MSKENKQKEQYLQKISETVKFDKSYSNTIHFNFRFFTFDDRAGQSFTDWQKEKILDDLNEKLKSFSSQTIQELKESRELVVYGSFPENSKFKEPKMFKGINAQWARLRLTQDRRLIGVMIPSRDAVARNIFYIVFLDKNHVFYPVNKNK